MARYVVVVSWGSGANASAFGVWEDHAAAHTQAEVWNQRIADVYCTAPGHGGTPVAFATQLFGKDQRRLFHQLLKSLHNEDPGEG